MSVLDPYIPTASKPWNKERVIHLLRRMGMGAAPVLINQGLSVDPSDFAETLLNGIKTRALPTPPVWANCDTAAYDAINNPDLKFDHRNELV
ncbi:MAG: hypothetical protein IPL08_13250 [Saprospiraceae bacterium]|nr:hypothetical protein [Saprospiraceae bacterium]